MKNGFDYEAELANLKGELEKAYQDLATLRGESLATGDMTHFAKLSQGGLGLVFTADSRREALAAQVVERQAVALSIPDECPHLIVFDDTDRENLLFSGAGARSAALKTWEKISMSWNAHMFVRVERNSRDDRYPSATPAPVAVIKPVVWRIPVNGDWFYGTKEQCEREYAEYTADFTAEDFDEAGPTSTEPLACLDKVKELDQ